MQCAIVPRSPGNVIGQQVLKWLATRTNEDEEVSEGYKLLYHRSHLLSISLVLLPQGENEPKKPLSSFQFALLPPENEIENLAVWSSLDVGQRP
jgi:hypothetical protein